MWLLSPRVLTWGITVSALVCGLYGYALCPGELGAGDSEPKHILCGLVLGFFGGFGFALLAVLCAMLWLLRYPLLIACLLLSLLHEVGDGAVRRGVNRVVDALEGALP